MPATRGDAKVAPRRRPDATDANQTGPGMLRFLKYLTILAVIGVIALWGYSYLLEPETAPVTTTIEIDAG